MPSQCSRVTEKPWTKIEVERLIAWMEKNQNALRGKKQLAWHKRVKQEVFPDEEHLTVGKITDKVANMKLSWKSAREMQERSGWGTGIRSEDNETSLNDALEKKCSFYWRLEAIWGTRPNIKIFAEIESISHEASQSASLSLSEASTEPPQRFQESEPPSPSLSTSPSSLRSQSVVIQESIEYESATKSDTGAVSASDSRAKRIPLYWLSEQRERKSGKKQRTGAVIKRAKKQKSHLKKHDLNALMHRALEAKQAAEVKLAQQQLKAKIDTARELLKVDTEAKIETARIQAAAKIEIARIQADGQVRQMGIFANMLKDVLAAIHGRGGSGSGGSGSGRSSSGRSGGGGSGRGGSRGDGSVNDEA